MTDLDSSRRLIVFIIQAMQTILHIAAVSGYVDMVGIIISDSRFTAINAIDRVSAHVAFITF